LTKATRLILTVYPIINCFFVVFAKRPVFTLADIWTLIISSEFNTFVLSKLLSSLHSKLFEIFVFVLVHHYLPFARNVEQKYTDYKIFKEDLTLLFFERQKSPHMPGWRLTT